MKTRSVAVAALLLFGASGARAAEPDLDPRIVKLLEQISVERLQQTIEKLVGFETRNTLSSPDSPTRGIGAARQWILDELKAASPLLRVSFDGYQVAGGQMQRIPRDFELRNVMALLPGKSPRRLYVSGHYDSLVLRRGQQGGATPGPSDAPPSSPDPASFELPAPGANDDGSGTALTIELARVFAASGIEFDATLVFLCLAGEEQGLVGAKLHAQKASVERWPIQAVLNNDIVGGSRGGSGILDSGSVRVFSEGPEDSPSRALARYVKRQAALYLPAHRVGLVARHDRFGRGGDHTAFNQHGFAAVRVSETAENYARQHTPLDTPEGVDFAYLARNAKVNAAALAGMALAPPPPAVVEERQGRSQPMLDRQPSRYDARLRWKPSPGAAGYRIFWRDSWTLDWQGERSVGNVSEVVLKDVSIDDYVFGVAALSADGHESVVSAYVNPQRPSAEIKTK